MAIAATACTDAPPQNSGEVAEQVPTEAVSQEPEVIALSEVDLERVCKAAIAGLFGHDPEIMSVTSNRSGIVRVEYRRPDDNKLWKNDCRVDEDKVIWRGVDAFGPGSGEGRWREHPMDEVINFAIDAAQVTISMTYSDGSSDSDTYTIN